MKNHTGFSLVELIIALGILAILMALAIPAYQDYTIRTRVAEGLYTAGSAKTAVVETFQTNSSVPDELSTGFSSSPSRYVDTIVIANDGSGIITITTKDTGAVEDPVLILTPDFTTSESFTTWRCEFTDGDMRHIPAECR